MIEMLSSSFKSAIAKIASTVPKRIEGLENIALVHGEETYFVAFNGDRGMRVDVEATGPSARILFPKEKITTLARVLSSEYVGIKTSGSSASIMFGVNKVNLTTPPYSEKFLVPLRPSNLVAVDKDDFSSAYKKTRGFCSLDDIRVTNGVKIGTENGTMKFSATDGFRFSISSAKCDGDLGDFVVVPPASIDAALGLSGDFSVGIVGSIFFIVRENGMIWSSTLAGRFPDVESKSFQLGKPSHCAVVNAEELIYSIDAAGVISGEKMAVDIKKNAITLSMNESDGDSSATTFCSYDGPEVSGFVLKKYLLQAASAFSGPVDFGIISGALYIGSGGDKTYTAMHSE